MRSGFVNIIGKPNAGKSTLLNAFIGEKLAIVSSKVQTTRHRIRAFLNGPDYQIVFSDTPGVVNAAYKLHEAMMEYVNASLKDADVLITDTWISMGEEAENNDAIKQRKINLLNPYQVNKTLMSLAKKNAIFTHCLPAYRGYEVSKEVLESKQSVVFDEAENRLHIQKAILVWALQ